VAVKKSITARVSCVVEIEVGTWGGEGPTDLTKLAEQVRHEGYRKVESLITSQGGKVIGTPKVQFIRMIEE
jgi:hypothetical protein